GAHYNPAVTLAAFLRGRCDKGDVVPYWAAQFAAGLVAALLVNYILQGRVDPAVVGRHPTIGSFIVEFLFTFALAWTVLNVATTKATMGNSFYGLAIGFTVVVGAFAGGSTSGGAFNPAVGIGPTLVHGLMGGGSFANLWYYLVGPLLGGWLAALVFKAQEQQS
ncbi:MAG TPA: aquaporin, partial [Gemmatimonadales bacterium]|nr:aquaporin [Gemmatimonadales bacterium]